MLKFVPLFIGTVIVGLVVYFSSYLRFSTSNVFASTNWPNDQFASAGVASSSIGDPYYYVWDAMSDPTPPDQIASGSAQTFARVVGKLDNRHDGLSCSSCTQSNIDQIYNAELPKIQDLLSRDVNKGGVWIVGNEANYSPQIPATLHAYQFKRYHDLIKSLDATAKLANSGLLFIGWPGVSTSLVLPGIDYLNTFLANLNQADWPDIYNLHLYPSGNNPSYYTNNINQARDFKANLIGKGEVNKPIWVTETGINFSGTQTDANNYMDNVITALFNQNLSNRWFWFIGTWEPGFDITALTRDGAVTPTGQYYLNLATRLAAATPNPGFALASITVTNITKTSATINWISTTQASSFVNYGKTTSLGINTPEDSNLVYIHSVNISGLTKNTTYYYKVNSRGGNGNLVTSSIASFKTASH